MEDGQELHLLTVNDCSCLESENERWTKRHKYLVCQFVIAKNRAFNRAHKHKIAHFRLDGLTVDKWHTVEKENLASIKFSKGMNCSWTMIEVELTSLMYSTMACCMLMSSDLMLSMNCSFRSHCTAQPRINSSAFRSSSSDASARKQTRRTSITASHNIPFTQLNI